MLHNAHLYSCCFSAGVRLSPLLLGGMDPDMTRLAASLAWDMAAASVSKFALTGAPPRSAAGLVAAWHIVHVCNAVTSS
jgi:hypothetical protein